MRQANDQRVPEDDPGQLGGVAEELDVERGEERDADDQPEDGGRHDGECGHAPSRVCPNDFLSRRTTL